jgi:hypothetical protein
MSSINAPIERWSYRTLIALNKIRSEAKNLAHLPKPSRRDRVHCLLILLNLLERNANGVA